MLHKSADGMLYFGVLFALFIRWCISLFPYSGAGKPPMYGDYEAQRHWMEITINLPTKEWYSNSTDNDLQYWGLDYPPLTAYHSWICGWVARKIDPRWVELNSSRGFESYNHKLFMRATVAVADLFVYIPALVVFWNTVGKPFKTRDKALATVLALIYPGLLLIDYGHFQFNCASLGLTLWAVVFLYWGWDLAGAATFAAALHYKQMALYQALPFFAYLLGRCFKTSSRLQGLSKFVFLGLTVLSATAVCWLPFISDLQVALQVLRRLFPVDRGLYEDKVANVWCALSAVVKLKQIFAQRTLVLISGLSTLGAALPSTIHLIRTPTFSAFRYALVNSSLAFFLFSYQVHEKSILLVAIPFLLLLDEQPKATVWFSLISTFSMLPLLLKDGLAVPYFALSVIFLVVALQAYPVMQLQASWQGIKKNGLMYVSLSACLALSIVHLLIRPPINLPDLWTLVNASFSCLHLVGFFIFGHVQQLQLGNLTVLKTKKRH